MSKRSREEEEHEDSERWLLTYSDMITLLLALFIMMYTISSVDSTKYKALSESLGAAFDPSHVAVAAPSVDSNIKFTDSPNYVPIESSMVKPSPSPSLSPSPSGSGNGSGKNGEMTQENIADKLKSLIKNAGLSNSAIVQIEERGVVVSMIDALLFPSGSATVNEDVKGLLKKITTIINSVDNNIHVEGSTDDVPINNGQFASNWELASQRAINVAKILINDGVKGTRVIVSDYGEFHPIADNDSENKKYNRRVDIVFVNKIYNAYEPGKIK